MQKSTSEKANRVIATHHLYKNPSVIWKTINPLLMLWTHPGYFPLFAHKFEKTKITSQDDLRNTEAGRWCKTLQKFYCLALFTVPCKSVHILSMRNKQVVHKCETAEKGSRKCPIKYIEVCSCNMIKCVTFARRSKLNLSTVF